MPLGVVCILMVADFETGLAGMRGFFSVVAADDSPRSYVPIVFRSQFARRCSCGLPLFAR